MTASLKPLNLGPFVPGMNNRRPDFAMRRRSKDDAGDFLRSAVNADVSETGSVARRKGYTQVLSATDCHSLWSDGGDTFMVSGQSLVRVSGLPGAATTSEIRTGLAIGRPMSFVRAPDAIYYSDSQYIGRIVGNSVLAVNTPGLARAPSLSPSSGGSLPPGVYGMCFTHRDASGRESGSTAPAYVEVFEEGGAIDVSGMPSSFPAGALETVVYMTTTNDQTLMRAMTLASTPSTLRIPVVPTLGARCQTILKRDMPPGHIVRHYGGRLLVAAGPLLYYSEPYMHGLFNPTRGYIPFAADIAVMEPVEGGLWVCTDKTYWLGSGDIEAASLDEVLPYGAVRGSSGAMSNSSSVYWMSPRGIVVATKEGQASNAQEGNVAVPASEFASGLFRESNGHKQIVSSTFNPGNNTMASSSYMDAEVIRKKETL